MSDLTQDYFAEELDQPSSNGGSGASTPTGSIVGDRIQLLGGTKQGFKRPAAPGRRRPPTTTTSTASSSAEAVTTTTEDTTTSS